MRSRAKLFLPATQSNIEFMPNSKQLGSKWNANLFRHGSRIELVYLAVQCLNLLLQLADIALQLCLH